MFYPEAHIGMKEFFSKRRTERLATWWTDDQGIIHIPTFSGHEALIDGRDRDLASQFVWCAVPGPKTVYAQATVPKELAHSFPLNRRIRLHRLLLGVGPKLLVDHIDRNGLNCTRKNIRVATFIQNGAYKINVPSKCRYRGVRQTLNGKRWTAQISFDSKLEYLGTFNTPEEAAAIYNQAAIQRFGEFSVLNQVAS